jgi:hypothetical protein
VRQASRFVQMLQHVAGAHDRADETREIAPYAWVHPDEERCGPLILTSIVAEFGPWTASSALDSSLRLAAQEDHEIRAFAVSALNASSEMIREDRGDAIPAIRSNASCGMTIGRARSLRCPGTSASARPATRSDLAMTVWKRAIGDLEGWRTVMPIEIKIDA